MTRTIYAVSIGEYSDYRVKALFSTKDKAEKFAERYRQDDARVEEYELDPEWTTLEDQGYHPWRITMTVTGDVLETKDLSSSGISTHEDIPHYYIDNARMKIRGFVWARSVEHAVKITNEKRAQLISLNAWETGVHYE